jgi:hypothetical protein
LSVARAEARVGAADQRDMSVSAPGGTQAENVSGQNGSSSSGGEGRK